MSAWAADNLKLFTSILIMLVTAVVFAFTNFETKGEADIQSKQIDNLRQDLKDMSLQLNNKLDALLERK